MQIRYSPRFWLIKISVQPVSQGLQQAVCGTCSQEGDNQVGTPASSLEWWCERLSNCCTCLKFLRDQLAHGQQNCMLVYCHFTSAHSHVVQLKSILLCMWSSSTTFFTNRLMNYTWIHLNWWLVDGTACIGEREHSYNVSIWTESYCLLIPTYSVVAIFFIPVPKAKLSVGHEVFLVHIWKGRLCSLKNRVGLLHNLAAKICKLWAAGHLVTCNAACKESYVGTC